MVYTLDFTTQPALELQPKEKHDETQQNLYCLLNTVIAEVPCYREFGIDMSYLGNPINVAKTMVVSAVAEALNSFFPELRLEHIEFDFDGDTPDMMGCRIEVTNDYEES